MRPPRALAARGALLGAIGGVTAGLSDFAQTLTRAGAFLPAGKWKLALFLATLYGAAGSVALALVGLALGAIVWCSDGGKIWRAAFAGEESTGARIGAYVAGGGGAAGRPRAARRSHRARDAAASTISRCLIAALVAAATAGLFFAGMLLTLVLAALLVAAGALRPARQDPLPRARRPGSGRLVPRALRRRRAASPRCSTRSNGSAAMPLAVKAHTLALWAPLIMLVCVFGAHIIARQLPLRERALATPRGALVSLALATTLPLFLVAAFQWPLVRQLDLRPFLALAVAFFVVVAALSTDAGDGLRRRPIWVRGLIAVAVPLVLLTMALGLGRADRVRKAASAFTGAAARSSASCSAPPTSTATATRRSSAAATATTSTATCTRARSTGPTTASTRTATATRPRWPRRRRRRGSRRRPLPADVNIVLITVDALRADHVGAYGYSRATTPRLDSLAARVDPLRRRLVARAVDALFDPGHPERPLSVDDRHRPGPLAAQCPARKPHARRDAQGPRLSHGRVHVLLLLRIGLGFESGLRRLRLPPADAALRSRRRSLAHVGHLVAAAGRRGRRLDRQEPRREVLLVDALLRHPLRLRAPSRYAGIELRRLGDGFV